MRWFLKNNHTACAEMTTGKRLLAAFLLGILMTLSLPPIGFFPVLLLCVPAFLFLARRSETKLKSFLTGWLFGCGYFIFGLYWVSAALFVDIEQWKWVLPLSLVAGPAVLALFYGFIPLLSHRWKDNAAAHALITVAAWSGIEWLRGHILTGFPWNLAGYTWNHAPPIMQISSVTGIYGLTLLTLFWAATPSYAGHKKLLRFSLTLFAVVVLSGALRLYLHPAVQNGKHTVRIVQANIPQTMKWDKDEDWRNLEKHVKLSGESKNPVTFVVWPETAVTSDLKLFPEIARYISMKMPEKSIGLLGSLRVTYDMHGRENFHNSVTALGGKGEVLGTYNKFHLVPFGEYIPFRGKLNMTPLALAIANIGDFTPGDGNKTLKIDGLPPVSPLVCYEAIFPREVVDQNDRPDWMVNVTNDGWYGKTAGPHQHFEITRVRAIEEGLPLARAANTGISAMIDPLGRVIARTELGQETYIDAILPAPLPKTLYAKLGDVIFFAALLLLTLFGVKNGRKQLIVQLRDSPSIPR